MRTITKTVSLPLTLSDQETPMDFRLTKLDAFSGAWLLKLLSRSATDDLQALILGLPEEDMERLMRTCLRSASALLPAGPIRVLEGDNWGIPDLEYDAWTCLKLTIEVVQWTLEGFFHESGSVS